MSLHTDRAFGKAQRRGASAAIDYETWTELMSMTKRELAEIAVHLAALATGCYEDALAGGSGEEHVISALERIREEHGNLKSCGII